jgi:hypothetical protein
MSAGRKIDGMNRTLRHVLHSLPATIKGICLHNCATATSIGVVVDLALLIYCVIPYLVGFNMQDAPLLRSTDDAISKNIKHRVRK